MKPFLWALGAVLVGMTVFELSMQPSWPDRLELGAIFLAMALAMWAASRWLPSVARRNRSIRITLLVLSLAAFAIVVGGAVAVGNRMFFSPHDLTLLLIVVAFGLVSAIGFATSVSGPLTEDIDRLADRASSVGMGNLDPSLDLHRRDEVGRLNRALNEMIGQLDQARADREADSDSRRDFFAAIGHDLRTPLTSMRAAVEAVRDGVGSDPARYLATIERDITALTSLVDDIYLLARLDSGAAAISIDRVDVTEIADESVEILRPLAAQRQVAVSLEHGQRFIARASAEPLGRVVRNLVDNAIRHSPPGGAVDISLEHYDGDIVVTVTDSGPGFDPDFRPFAFERFSRSESARSRDTGGSGLGLAIARGLVEAMDGHIWIAESESGQVRFALPSPESAVRDSEAIGRATARI